MDQHRFDRLTRSVIDARSRRGLLRGFGATGLGFVAARLPQTADARKKRKKLRLNGYGCVEVGKPCRGDRICCSGICQGKKPKPGRKDRSRCVAHNASTCLTGQRNLDICGGATNVPCTTNTGAVGVCDTTTGGAPYCTATLHAYPCRKDADCRPFCGETAACILCAGAPDGTACASPTAGLCSFPD